MTGGGGGKGETRQGEREEEAGLWGLRSASCDGGGGRRGMPPRWALDIYYIGTPRYYGGGGGKG